MRMTLKEVNRHFTELAGFGKKVFPSRLGFAISCNLERMQEEIERVENERKKLCEMYAEKDESGNVLMAESVINGQKMQEYKMSEENKKAFSEEYTQLLETEVEIDIRKSGMEEIEQCEKIERYDLLSVAELLALSFMLEE